MPGGVKLLAYHEQVNVLQRIIYNDTVFVLLLQGNQASYITGFPSGVAQPVELTLAGQCRGLDDGRTVGFEDSPIANLANPEQRMQFVIRAANQFHDLLHSSSRGLVEKSIKSIASGGGVQ